MLEFILITIGWFVIGAILSSIFSAIEIVFFRSQKEITVDFLIQFIKAIVLGIFLGPLLLFFGMLWLVDEISDKYGDKVLYNPNEKK